MKIQRVTFLGVRGLPDGSIDATDPETGLASDRVIVTGPPASGKTRALEVIAAARDALAPAGEQATGAAWIARGGAAAKVTIAFALDAEEQAYAGTSSAILEGEVTFLPEATRADADEGLVAVLDRYDHDSGTGKLEYFPATRRIPMIPPFAALDAFEQRGLRAGKEARKYGFVQRFLRDMEEAPPLANAFAARLAALSPTCRWERAAPGDGLPRCFRSRGGPLVTAAELSDGENDAVLLAATATAIQLVRSVVLIDRPELHATPADVPKLVAALPALGEGNQVWLASAAPAVLAAARGARVVDLAGLGRPAA
jgi:hypothetical protein